MLLPVVLTVGIVCLAFLLLAVTASERSARLERERELRGFAELLTKAVKDTSAAPIPDETEHANGG